MFYILTKENCSWCDKAKFLLEKKGVPYGAFNYRTHPLFPYLLKSAKLNTVPQIWADTPDGKVHIGGYQELEDYFVYQENELEKK
jgi:glutaredoxin